MLSRLGCYLLTVSLLTAVCPAFSQTTSLVRTHLGWISGIQEGQSMVYLGIPFAAPPTDSLRWKAPVEPSPWRGVRPATAFSSPCPQLDDDNNVIGDEDCLYLNVWKPVTARATSRLPVLVFIHGGGNVKGSASEVLEQGGITIYNGQRLAERGSVIVVTVQYRLGALGYLVHPDLSAENPQGVSGNYGLRDQIAALQWVQRNIGMFGGDPNRVLLFGESAGAVNTCMLMTSPLATGLFSRALMQSGSCTAKSAEARAAEGVTFAAAVNCERVSDVAACLRQVDAATLVTAIDSTPISPIGLVTQAFGPNVDGDVLPIEPMQALESGHYTPVPFMVGANADETSLFGIPLTLTEVQYRGILYAAFGVMTGNAVLARYPVTRYQSPRHALVAVTTDSQFVCPSRRIARAASVQKTPVYRYFFTHALSNPLGEVAGATHGLELLFVFQQMGASPAYLPTESDVAVEAAILGYWTRFAATGNPNGGSAVSWPPYVADADPFLEFADPVQAGDGVRTALCDFWDGFAQAR